MLCTPSETDSDVSFSSSYDQEKITKRRLKDNCGCLIDFLSQISKLSYFSLFGLADFLMHHWFPVSFFDVAILQVCVNTAAHLCLQYVHHFELRH